MVMSANDMNFFPECAPSATYESSTLWTDLSRACYGCRSMSARTLACEVRCTCCCCGCHDNPGDVCVCDAGMS